MKQNNDVKTKQISDSTAHGRFLQHAGNGQSFGDWNDDQCGVKRAPMKPQQGVDATVQINRGGPQWRDAVVVGLIDTDLHGPGPWAIPKANEIARNLIATFGETSNNYLCVRVLDVDGRTEHAKFRVDGDKAVT